MLKILQLKINAFQYKTVSNMMDAILFQFSNWTVQFSNVNFIDGNVATQCQKAGCPWWSFEGMCCLYREGESSRL